MQSWGTSSRFETRMTDYYPSKSAVIGIIAASFGYKRDDDEKIQRLNDLDFAVRIDQQGVLKNDYHIAIKYKAGIDVGEKEVAEKNYETNRYYMEDAVYVVAISHADEAWMDEIHDALRHPYFQPFMGRRSYPLPPDFIIDMVEDGAIEALETLEWQAAPWYRKKHTQYRADIYADKDLIPDAPHALRNDRVVSFSQKARRFGPRFETRSDIIMANGGERPQDFFGSI